MQEHEIHFVREHGGDLETLQNQLTQALNHSSEILASGLSLEEKLALAKKEKTELQKKLTTSGGTSQDQVFVMHFAVFMEFISLDVSFC